MKKILITLLVLFTAFTSFAQFPNTLRQSNKSTLILYNGGVGADSTIVLAYSFADTTAANGGWLKGVAGAFIRTDSNKLYMRTGCKCEWKLIGTGGSGTVIVNGIDSVVFYPPNKICTWEGGFSSCFDLDKFFDSSSLNYNNTRYIYWNNGIQVDSVLAITGVPADSIYFISPLHVEVKTVSMQQVSSVDSGWTAPFQKVDSVVFRGNLLYTYSDDSVRLVGSTNTGGLPNGLISANITLVDSTVTITDPILRRNDTTISLPGSTSFVIHAIDSGYYQSILAYITQGNVVDTVQGVKDTTVAVPPALPMGGTLVTTITVFGNTITPPVPAIPTNFWNLTGNVGVNASNFLGSINNANVRFRVNNLQSVILDSFTRNLVAIKNIWADSGSIRIQNISGNRSIDAISGLNITINGSNTNSLILGGSVNSLNGNAGIELNPNGTQVGYHPFQFTSASTDRSEFTIGRYNTGIVRKYGIIRGYSFAGNTFGTDLVLYGGTETNSGAVGDVILAHDLTNPIGAVDIGTSTNIPSAILNVASTTKGALLPRMTAAKRLAILSPATGMIVFDTDSSSYFQKSASAWQNLYNTGGGGGSGVTTLAAIGATPNANGATISGSTLNLQPASNSFGGVVTTGTQAFAGNKTFTDSATMNAKLTVNGRTTLNSNLDVAGQATFSAGLETTGIGIEPIGTGSIPGTIFSITSTTAASIPAPRMNTTQMNAITPLTGFMIYNTDSAAYCYYNGGVWRMIGSSSGGGSLTLQQVTDNGNTITSGGTSSTFTAGNMFINNGTNNIEFDVSGLFFNNATNGASLSLQAGGSLNGALKFPDFSGIQVMPISVNGNFADAAGDITVTADPPFLPVTGTGTATGNVTGDLNGNTLTIADISGTNVPTFTIRNNLISFYFDNLPNQINLRAADSSNEYLANKHTFTGKINLLTVSNGVAGTDSLLVIKDTEVKKVAASTFLTPANFVYNEEFINSTSSTITLANTPIANKITVYKNTLKLPKSEWSLSGATITLTGSRLVSDLFSIDYIK